MDFPIDVTTITTIVGIIMEKEGSDFCMNVMRHIRNGKFITMVESRTKVSILVKMIQMFYSTKEGMSKGISKKKRRK